MCCDAPEAPKPDPAIGQAAASNVALGKDWLDFSKQQWEAGNVRQDDYDKLIKNVVDQQVQTQDKANLWGQQDRDLGQAGKAQYDQLAGQAGELGSKYEAALNGIGATYGGKAGEQFDFAKTQQDRYKTQFAPIEDKLAKDAMSWDSQERLDAESAKAKADVLSGAAQQQQANQRNLTSMGVNPNSGRFAAAGSADAINTALGSAGAQNVTRDNIRSQGIQLRGQAAQIGQQVQANASGANALGLQATQGQQNAQQAASGAATAGITQAGQLKGAGLGAAGVGYQGLGVGLTAGNSAVGNQGAGQASFNANNAAMGAGYSGAIGANTSAGGILNNQYGNQINAYNAQNSASNSSAAGIGSLVTGAANLGLKAYGMGMFSSKDYKTDKKPVAGALAALNGMPVESWKYKDGIADEGEHIGPYAEDFQAATGKGDGKTIPVVDAIGVTMKAVQELSKKVDKMASKGAR